MNKLHVYLELGLADFRERTRRSSFLVMMLAILFFGYLVITGKYTMQFGEYRTVYDAQWAGTLMATCSAVMLALFGFYLIKGSIKRDRQTEVGQIIAATPMTKRAYLVSKLVSNTMVLWFMVAVLAVMAFLTLLIRNEAGSIGLWAFIAPFLMISLPAMMFVAAMAVLFESARWLRGSIGNVIYLFAAEICIVLGITGVSLLDLGGVNIFTESVKAAARAAFPGESIPLLVGFAVFDPQMQVEAFKIFVWDGIRWTWDVWQLRLIWLAAAAVVTGMAVPLFDRFDPSKARKEKPGKAARSAEEVCDEKSSKGRPRLPYGELKTPVFGFSLVTMIVAELRLALKGYHWFWYVMALGLLVAQAVVPFGIAREYITPISMIWPLVIWSSMGTREAQFGTGPMLFSSPEPIRRQLSAIWLSGLFVALASVSSMTVRALASGQVHYVGALMIGAFFVPAAALALGTLSRSKRLFEVAYLMFWYVGSIEHLAAIDLLGTMEESISAGKFTFLCLLSAGFIILAFLARQSQVRRA